MLTKRPLQGNTHDGNLSAKPLPVTRPDRAGSPRACPERSGILGACAVSRYGRYKSRLWRHTHDTLVSQNDRSPERQAGSLLRRERELWQLHLFWKPTGTAGSRIAAAPIKPGTSNHFGCIRLLPVHDFPLSDRWRNHGPTP